MELDLKIDDTVISSLYGTGRVVEVIPVFSRYPIEVLFRSGIYVYYSKSGRNWEMDENIRLATKLELALK